MSREKRVDEFPDLFHKAVQKVLAFKTSVFLEYCCLTPEELRKNLYEFRYAVRREKQYWPQYWPDINALQFTIEGDKVKIAYTNEEDKENVN